MGRRRLLVFLFFCYIHAVASSAGPPAAAPPDLETLQRSLREGDGIGRVRRVVITKRTTEGTTPMGVEETVETTTEALKKEEKTTIERTTEQAVGTTERTVEARTMEVTEEKIISTTEKTSRTSDASDFADPDFSGEKKTESEVTNGETTSVVPETTTEEKIETTTEDNTTVTTTSAPTTVSTQTSTVEEKTTRQETTTATTMETTTEERHRNTSPPKTTLATTTEKETETTTTESRTRAESLRMGRRRVIIRKKKPITEELENTTVTTMETTTAEETTTRSSPQQPQDDDHLTPLEELRLLKKLAKQGIAFGVRNKELELIHNEKGELSLPPFAFSEDENSVVETTETEEATEETTPFTSKAPVTTTSTTTEATTTSTEAPTTTIPHTTAAVKEGHLIKEKTRFESESFKVGTNLVPVHLFFNQNRMMRKRKRVRTTTVAPQVEEDRAATVSHEIPTKPRTNDFLIAVPEQMSEKEEAKRLDSFTFPSPPQSTERTTMKPIPKSKMPEKMVLPSLLEMPKLSALSSFGSLAVPVHPMGVSQRIRLTRIDSEALAPPAVGKNRTAGTMRGQRRRRILRKKTTVLGVTNHSVDRDTVPRIVVRPRFVAEPTKHAQGPQEQTTTVTVPQVVKTNDPVLVEKKFAETLRKKNEPASTMDLVVESLRKMKKANRILLEQRRSRARAASAGKTVQAATLNAHHHDGQVGMARVEGSVDERRPPVIDRDLNRKTVDRDV